MKLLVTGGAGFIGSNFVHYMRRNYPQYQLVNVDLLTYAGNLDNLQGLTEGTDYRFVKADISDPVMMEAIVGASQILTRTLVQRMVERRPPDILIRSGLDGIGGLDFFKAKAILAAAEPIKDEVKRALERALAATG